MMADASHPNVDVVRRAFAAMETGDMAAGLEIFSPDLAYFGADQLGRFRSFDSRDEFFGMVMEGMALNNRFENELVDAFAVGDGRAVFFEHEIEIEAEAVTCRGDPCVNNIEPELIEHGGRDGETVVAMRRKREDRRGAALQTALHGAERRIDMCWIVLENARTGDRSTSNFLVMGGIGLDAEVIAATRDGLKKRVGWLAYSEAGVRLLPGPRRRMRIQADGGAADVRKVSSVLIANTGRLPAGIDFIPSAAVDDGMLDIVVLSPRTVFGWAAVAGKVVTRNRRDLPLIEYSRARTVTVSTEEPTITQLDGDLSGAATSVTVTVDPQSLRVRTANTGLATGPAA